MDLRCRARPGDAEAEPAITYNHSQPDEHGPERGRLHIRARRRQRAHSRTRRAGTAALDPRAGKARTTPARGGRIDVEFKPIETQEQFDEMVKERIERAKS